MLMNAGRTRCQPTDADLIGQSHAAKARPFLSLFPEFQPTPLLSLPDAASRLDLAAVHIKAEWSRMGLSSFKGLGACYAVALLALKRLELVLGRPALPDELLSLEGRSVAFELTVVCASAGNHGLAVATGAAAFGARAIVYLNEAVPEVFAAELRRRKAVVVRAGVSYEESMELAARAAKRRGWILVSDSSWPGYTSVPLDVMRGYTTLLEEAAQAMEEAGGAATHIFVQAGVGGLAASAVGYLRDRWGEGLTFTVVEPQGADCLLASAREGRCVRIEGAPTALGRLDCKQPSLLAFDLLSRLADAFMSVSDAEANKSAALLCKQGAPVSACGAAGMAGLIKACGDGASRQHLALDSNSRVLLIGTEGACLSGQGALS